MWGRVGTGLGFPGGVMWLRTVSYAARTVWRKASGMLGHNGMLGRSRMLGCTMLEMLQEDLVNGQECC